MVSFLKTAMAGAAATMILPTAGGAATIIIDDFTQPQTVQDVPSDVGGSESTVAGAMLGGFRYMAVENADGIVSGTALNSQNGSLSFNNFSTTTGVGWIVYDGTADRETAIDFSMDGVGVNTAGLNANLQPVLNFDSIFRFDLSGFNPGTGGATALFSAFAWDTTGARAEYNEIVGDSSINANLRLSEFSGGIDWTQVGALAFRIDSRFGTSPVGDFGGDNFDGLVGAVTVTAIPLPASALLLLGGMGSLAAASAFRYRRRQKV